MSRMALDVCVTAHELLDRARSLLVVSVADPGHVSLEFPYHRQKRRVTRCVEHYGREIPDKSQVARGMFKTSSSTGNDVTFRQLSSHRPEIDTDASASNVDDQEAAVIEPEDATSCCDWEEQWRVARRAGN